MAQPFTGEIDENGWIWTADGKPVTDHNGLPVVAAPVPTTGKTPATPATTTTTPATTTPATPAAPPPASAVTAGTGTDGMAPFTGFAKEYGYTGAMADQVYQNPWYILADALAGSETTDPIYQSLRNMKGDPLALYNMTQGASQNFQQEQGANEFINWLAGMYQQMATPGAGGFSGRELLSNIFNQKTGEDGSTSSSLASILAAGDITDQVRTLYNLAKDATSMGMNPLAATGYQAALARALDQYGNSQLSAGTDQSMGPLEWLKQNAGGVVVR